MAGFKGHLKGGAVFAVAAAGIVMTQRQSLGMTAIADAGIIMSSTMVGSLLPDMDHPQSFLGRRIRVISRPLYKFFGHRTLTHSFFFIGGMAYLLYKRQMALVALGLGSGMISHVVLDLLCMGSGVAFLYPLYTRKISLDMTHLFKGLFKKKRKAKRR